MNIRNTAVLVMVILSSLNCKSQVQSDTTYWEINNIYREDRSPFKGLTEDAMQEILDYNFHFKREGDSLDHIHEALMERKAVAEKINTLKLELTSSPQIILDPAHKLPQKSLVIEDDQGKAITLLVPKEIELKKTGQIKTQRFGAIKIGTFVKQAVVYDIMHNNKDYGLKQLAIWVSTDPAAFDLRAWERENPNRMIFKEDSGKVMGYELDYDQAKKQAIIRSFFCLKYKKVGQAHVFVYADVYRAQFGGNYNPLKEMNEILNFNHLILSNIKIQ